GAVRVGGHRLPVPPAATAVAVGQPASGPVRHCALVRPGAGAVRRVPGGRRRGPRDPAGRRISGGRGRIRRSVRPGTGAGGGGGCGRPLGPGLAGYAAGGGAIRRPALGPDRGVPHRRGPRVSDTGPSARAGRGKNRDNEAGPYGAPTVGDGSPV